MFEINTAVRINDPANFYNGKTVVIRDVKRFGADVLYTVDLKTDGAVITFVLSDDQFEVRTEKHMKG